MANLSIRNLAEISRRDPQVGQALRDLQTSHNYVAQQVNATPIGQTPAPQKPDKLVVTGGAGIIHATVHDTSNAYRGNEYHMEVIPAGGNWNTDAHPISLGPSRAYRGQLGSGKYELRACAGYSTSNPSPWVYSGEVDATGSEPPAFHKTTGSGTGGGGYGTVPYVGPTAPARS